MVKLSLSALVANHAGVLLRVVGLFSRRGYNIQSLTVSETEDPRFSRMTIVSDEMCIRDRCHPFSVHQDGPDSNPPRSVP